MNNNVSEIGPGGTTRVAVCPVEGGTAPAQSRQRAAALKALRSLAGAEASFAHRPDGSPLVVGSGLRVSVSHSAKMAAVVVDDMAAVGVDIEEPRTAQLRRVAPRVLSEAEAAAYASDEGLLRAWTLKEALYKAAGVAGADWRSDIALPLPPGTANARVCGRAFEVLFSGIVAGGSMLSVVREVSP